MKTHDKTIHDKERAHSVLRAIMREIAMVKACPAVVCAPLALLHPITVFSIMR